MSDHRCYQGPRFDRLESEGASLEQRYREHDRAMHDALLELGNEITSIGQNVAESVTELSARVAELAEEVRRR